MFGTALYLAHRCLQRAAEPIRYWKARRDLKRFTAPLDKQEAEARAKHRPVKHIQAARAALIVHALSHPQTGN